MVCPASTDPAQKWVFTKNVSKIMLKKKLVWNDLIWNLCSPLLFASITIPHIAIVPLGLIMLIGIKWIKMEVNCAELVVQ